jgi:hypothetical protein
MKKLRRTTPLGRILAATSTLPLTAFASGWMLSSTALLLVVAPIAAALCLLVFVLIPQQPA